MTTFTTSRLNLRPARKERLGDQLYGQILEQIVSGALKEGERLPSEKEICRIFAVSRAVVREALMRLQAHGLVSAQQGVGTFVLRRPPRSVIELAEPSDVASIFTCFEVRIAFESEAAALAARRRTETHMQQMRTSLEAFLRCMKAGEPAIKADLAFHRIVAEASGNEYFAILLESAHLGVEKWMSIATGLTAKMGSPERIKRVHDEHLRIIEALEERDVEQARLAMRYHLEQAKRRLTDHQREA